MNAKDLLAVLVMIVPGFLLIALIAFSLVPASVMQPIPGSGLAPDLRRTGPDRPPVLERGHGTGMVMVRSAPGTATQKRMRDPWNGQRSKSSSTL